MPHFRSNCCRSGNGSGVEHHFLDACLMGVPTRQTGGVHAIDVAGARLLVAVVVEGQRVAAEHGVGFRCLRLVDAQKRQ